MKLILFNKSTIRSVTPERLEYVDDEGNLAEINFESCRNNDVERINAANKERKPGHLYIDSPQTWKTVANRNVIGDPPWSLEPYKNRAYIEFYTRPPTRFEFEASEEGRQDYYAFRTLLEEAGWRTFDIS